MDRQAKDLISREEVDLALSQVAGIATAELSALAAKLPQIDDAEFSEAARRIKSARAKASK